VVDVAIVDGRDAERLRAALSDQGQPADAMTRVV
jgi:hypothetical protein